MRRRLGSAANSPGRSAQDADERETRRGNALTATRSTVEPVLSRHSAPAARRLLKRATRTRVGVEPDGGVSGTRDREGREALVERFLHLVRGLARRFRRGGELLEDLGQPAVLALIKAIDGFDPGRGTAFSSFALPSIVGALKRHYRDVGCAVRPPRELQELALRVSPASDQVGASTASLPTAARVAAHAHVSVADVLGTRAAYASLYSESRDRPRNRAITATAAR